MPDLTPSKAFAREKIEALVGDQFVNVRPSLVRALNGNGNAAILIEQLLFWSHLSTDPDGWFSMTRDQLEAQTGLGKDAQLTARKLLSALGVLHSERRGLSSIIHFRLDLDQFAQLMVEAESKAEDRSGFVYLLYSQYFDYCKIGKAKDVDARVLQLEIQLPFTVSLLHRIPCRDMSASERFLHRRYHDRRLNGEWFKLDREEIEWICRLTSDPAESER